MLLHCATNDIRACAIAGGGGLGMLDLYEEVDREIPLKGRRWMIEPHQRRLAARRRAHRAHGPGADHPHQRLSLQGAGRDANRLPPEQHDEIVPLNALREAGVTVSLATDNVPISLWLPVQQTIVRKDYQVRAAQVGAEAGAVAHGGAALRHR